MRRRVVCGCCTGLAGAVRGRVRLGALQGMACRGMHGWSGYFGSFAARPKFSERGDEMHGAHGSRTGSRASWILAGHGLRGNARLERVFLIFYKLRINSAIYSGPPPKIARRNFFQKTRATRANAQDTMQGNGCRRTGTRSAPVRPVREGGAVSMQTTGVTPAITLTNSNTGRRLDRPGRPPSQVTINAYTRKETK